MLRRSFCSEVNCTVWTRSIYATIMRSWPISEKETLKVKAFWTEHINHCLRIFTFMIVRGRSSPNYAFSPGDCFRHVRESLYSFQQYWNKHITHIDALMHTLIRHLSVSSFVFSLIFCMSIRLTFTVVLFYDFLLTLPDQINYFWRAPASWIAILLIATRYLALVGAVPIAITTYTAIQAHVHDSSDHSESWLTVLLSCRGMHFSS